MAMFIAAVSIPCRGFAIALVIVFAAIAITTLAK